MFPVCAFEHLGESFDPSTAVPDNHPMVAARPDLFSTDPAPAGKAKSTPKKASA